MDLSVWVYSSIKFHRVSYSRQCPKVRNMHMAGVELVALSDAQQRKVWLRLRKKTTAPEAKA